MPERVKEPCREKIIKAFDLLNTKWNIAYPASVFVDRTGVVRAILREKSYRQRAKISDMLRVTDETLAGK